MVLHLERNSNNFNAHEKQSNNIDPMADPLEATRTENLSNTFVFVNGRRLIANLPSIIFPHDNFEATRNYRHHYIYKYIWRGLLSAPVKETLIFGNVKCLDVACGSGIWSMDMAKESPKSTFVGIDIGRDFPNDEVKPPNVGFLSGCNLFDGIPFPDDTFNYIHQRHLFVEFPIGTWINTVIPEIIRVTKPLGWVEVDDIDYEPKNMGPVNKEFNKALRALSVKLGLLNDSVSQVSHEFSRAGLINIQSIKKNIPIGSWGGQIGDLVFKDMVDTILSLKTVLQTQMDVTEEKYFQMIQQFGQEVNEYKTYVMVYRVWGQRP